MSGPGHLREGSEPPRRQWGLPGQLSQDWETCLSTLSLDRFFLVPPVFSSGSSVPTGSDLSMGLSWAGTRSSS